MPYGGQKQGLSYVFGPLWEGDVGRRQRRYGGSSSTTAASSRERLSVRRGLELSSVPQIATVRGVR